MPTADVRGIFVYRGGSSITDLNVGDKVRPDRHNLRVRRSYGGWRNIDATDVAHDRCRLQHRQRRDSGGCDAARSHRRRSRRYEGMLIHLASATVAQNYWLGRYGQMTLSGSGRLYQPTSQYLPNSAGAIALASLQRAAR